MPTNPKEHFHRTPATSPTRTRAVSGVEQESVVERRPTQPQPLDANAFRDVMAPTRRRDMYINDFDTTQDDATDWFDDYDRVAESLNWSENKKKDHLYQFVDDRGKQWIKALELRPAGGLFFQVQDMAWKDLSWKQVREAFVYHFDTSIQRKNRWEHLFHEPQRKGEPIYAYLDNKERAGRELGKQDKDIVYQMHYHLLPVYHSLIGARYYKTIKDIYEALKFADEILDHQENDGKIRRDDSSKNEKAFAKLERKCEELAAQLKQAKAQEERPPRTCYNCGAQGHSIRDCRAPRSNNQRQGPPGNGFQPQRQVSYPSQRNQSYNQRSFSSEIPRNIDYYRQPNERQKQPYNALQQPYDQQFGDPSYDSSDNQNYYHQNTPYNQSVPQLPFRPNQQQLTDGPAQGQNKPQANSNLRQNLIIQSNLDDDEEAPLTGQINQVATTSQVARYSKYKDALLLEISIGAKQVSGLIDTGSSFTCIDWNYYEDHLAEDYKLLEYDGLSLRTADKSPMAVRGTVKFKANYKDSSGEVCEILIHAIVIESLNAPILLGREFIRRTNMTIKSNSIVMGDPAENINAIFSVQDDAECSRHPTDPIKVECGKAGCQAVNLQDSDHDARQALQVTKTSQTTNGLQQIGEFLQTNDFPRNYETSNHVDSPINNKKQQPTAILEETPGTLVEQRINNRATSIEQVREQVRNEQVVDVNTSEEVSGAKNVSDFSEESIQFVTNRFACEEDQTVVQTKNRKVDINSKTKRIKQRTTWSMLDRNLNVKSSKKAPVKFSVLAHKGFKNVRTEQSVPDQNSCEPPAMRYSMRQIPKNGSSEGKGWYEIIIQIIVMILALFGLFIMATHVLQLEMWKRTNTKGSKNCEPQPNHILFNQPYYGIFMELPTENANYGDRNLQTWCSEHQDKAASGKFYNRHNDWISSSSRYRRLKRNKRQPRIEDTTQTEYVIQTTASNDRRPTSQERNFTIDIKRASERSSHHSYSTYKKTNIAAREKRLATAYILGIMAAAAHMISPLI